MAQAHRSWQPLNRGTTADSPRFTDYRPVSGSRAQQAQRPIDNIETTDYYHANGSTPTTQGHHLAPVDENSRSNFDPRSASLRRPTTNASTASSSVQVRRSKDSKVRSALGLHAQNPVDAEHDASPHSDLLWPRIRSVLREPFGEFWGVFILVMFGDGSVAQVMLSENLNTAPGGMGFGNYQSVSWGWGLGTLLGIYVAGDSGAFLNPAITLAFCIFRGLPFRRWPVYLVAQFLGGFVAAGVVYANYVQAIDAYAGVGVRTVPPDPNSTAQVFATYPQSFLGKGNQFLSEFITSTLLMFCILALKDESNNGAAIGSGNWFPLSLFFLIFGLGACFGYETGYAINLARDFGPRLMTYCVGYGTEVWSAGDYYFWVPIVASFTGCFFGAVLYDFFIYTGPESPINSPYLGLPYLLNPVKFVRERWDDRGREVLIERDDEGHDLENGADGKANGGIDVTQKKDVEEGPGLLQ